MIAAAGDQALRHGSGHEAQVIAFGAQFDPWGGRSSACRLLTAVLHM